jgi:hypothetical protein
MEKCGNCNKDVHYSLIDCPTCAEPLGPPNMRMASIPAQKEAMGKRYEEACQSARDRSCEDALKEFEGACDSSFAVINMDAKFLDSFLSNDKLSYSGYKKQVDAGIRIPAIPEDASMREAAEAIMFPSFGAEITYAALSIDGRGLGSFGPISIRLREDVIRNRATVLQMNSYDFVTDGNRLYKHEDLPEGYIATWDDRAKLCVIKCADTVQSGQSVDEYGRILLYSEDDKKTDEFLEVHIFKSFDNNAIEAVHGNSFVGSKRVRSDVKRIRDRLKKKSIKWMEIP